MNDDFVRIIRRESKFKDVSELATGEQIISVEHMIIPECCREGWDSCPHVPKKQKVARKNVGL